MRDTCWPVLVNDLCVIGLRLTSWAIRAGDGDQVAPVPADVLCTDHRLKLRCVLRFILPLQSTGTP